MSTQYGCIAFTDDVRRTQAAYGSAEFFARMAGRAVSAPAVDSLGAREISFLRARDGLYLSTVSATGWPYVQFRGGPSGFVMARDEHTIGWADFRGNLQHASTGNLRGDDRVALIAVDYPARRRLKLFGHARVVRIQDDPELVRPFVVGGYEAVVESAVIIGVVAFDSNCPQHIPRRFTLEQVDETLAPLRDRIAVLETENARLRSMVAGG